MWRMKASASISNRRSSPSRRQAAATTSRRKRWWYVLVGVKAVKSRAPTSAAAQASSAATSIRCGHQSARERSNGDGAGRASTR